MAADLPTFYDACFRGAVAEALAALAECGGDTVRNRDCDLDDGLFALATRHDAGPLRAVVAGGLAAGTLRLDDLRTVEPDGTPWLLHVAARAAGEACLRVLREWIPQPGAD